MLVETRAGGRLLRDRYEPLEVVGSGGEGEVVLARDHQHDRRVAIKIRHVAGDADRERILSEARLLLNLRPHGSVPLVREDFFANDRYYLVMDWVEGANLATTLRQNGTPGLGYEVVCRWMSQVAEALDHLHSHDPPILHKDVKPANVVLTSDDHAVLVDFGIARSTAAATSAAGTPMYIAPEITSGRPPGRAADVFALAVTTFELLSGTLPAPGTVADWSTVPPEHRERVLEALAKGLAIDPDNRPPSAGTFAEMLVPPSTPHNLPASFSSFVGRDREVDELVDLLTTERLLTLTGTGGVGKTRLAIGVAMRVLARYPAGITLVELGALTNPDLVVNAVAKALGLTPPPGTPMLEVIIAALTSGRRLIVLDNCEHVIDATAHLAEALLRSCPDLSILATSREALRLTGERAWPVPSLEIAVEGDSLGEILASESVRLFCDRARAAGRDLELDLPNATSLAHVCGRLDGIPLAIELVAPLVTRFDPAEIADRLDDRFRLLTGASRTALERHQTLRAAVDWSFSLLEERERALLRRMSVFASGFRSEELADVCADELLLTGDVEAVADRLVEKSLVEHDHRDRKRFRLLETIRQYARDRLVEAGESEALRRRHRDRFMEIVEGAVPHLVGPDSPGWVSRLGLEHDNLRAAHDWSLGDDPTKGLRIEAALYPLWLVSAQWEEARVRLEAALDAHDGSVTRTRARCLAALAQFTAGVTEGAETMALEALTTARAAGDVLAEAIALCVEAECAILQQRPDAGEAVQAAVDASRRLGHEEPLAPRVQQYGFNLLLTLDQDGRWDRAPQHVEDFRRLAEATRDPYLRMTVPMWSALFDSPGADLSYAEWEELIELSRELDHRTLEAGLKSAVGMTAIRKGDLERARSAFEEAAIYHRKTGYTADVASSLLFRGHLAVVDRDIPTATACYDETLAIGAFMPWFVQQSEAGRAFTAVLQGNTKDAARHAASSLELARSYPDRMAASDSLRAAAGVAAMGGDVEATAVLLGAEDSVLHNTPQLWRTFRDLLDPVVVGSTVHEMEGGPLRSGTERGRTMTRAEVIDLALATVHSAV